jgi:hypothetical protein
MHTLQEEAGSQYDTSNLGLVAPVHSELPARKQIPELLDMSTTASRCFGAILTIPARLPYTEGTLLQVTALGRRKELLSLICVTNGIISFLTQG